MLTAVLSANVKLWPQNCASGQKIAGELEYRLTDVSRQSFLFRCIYHTADMSRLCSSVKRLLQPDTETQMPGFHEIFWNCDCMQDTIV